jgi:uncharacterized membrane protein YgdD (TMEM256/DUF423 family)
MMIERIWIGLAALSGAAAVGADAAARHLLTGEADRLALAQTGARYGLIHALALLAAAFLAGSGRVGARVWLGLAGWCFAAGLALFPGSLYLLAAGLPAGIARLTPIGGSAFIAGWLALLLAALWPRRAG